MKTNVSDTSLFAYWRMRDSGELSRREKEVYNALLKHGAMTREELARVTGQKEGSVCGRVADLKKKGLVVGVATKLNMVTDNMNQMVDLAPHRKAMHVPKTQANLFDLVPA